jgi:glucose-6-phosphate 1-dehydrogenase
MSQIIPVDPFDYVVFGGTGDLAERKLLPALYHRQLAGQLTDPTRIIGASRAAMDHDGYRSFARDALKQHLKPGEYAEDEINRFLERLFYVAVDARSDQGWDRAEGTARRRQATGCGRSIWPSVRRCSATFPRRSAPTGW